MASLYGRYKKIVIFALLMIMSLASARIIYHYQKDAILSLVYQTENIIPDRTYEDQRMYPRKSLKQTLFDHLKVILPALVVVSASLILYLTLGNIAFLRLMMFLTCGFAALLSLVVFALSPKQYLILLLPVISSYVFVSAFLKPDNLIDKVNFTVLNCFAQVIILTQLLSLAGAIDADRFLMAAVFIFVISLLWFKRLGGYVKNDYRMLQASGRNLLEMVNSNKWVSALVAALLCSGLWRMILIVYVPPNNGDGNMYHLSRVAHWLQNQSLEVFHSHDIIRQVMFPFDSDVLLLWTMIASKSDFLTGFIQFICYVLTGTLIYKCLKICFSCDRITALIPALIWYALPQVVLESTTVQNDIVFGYFVMASLIYLLIKNCSQRSYLFISAMALMLALGAKVTAYFYLVPFMFVVLFLVAQNYFKRKQFLYYTGLVFVFYLLLVSYNHLQNYIAFGSVIAPDELHRYVKINQPSFKITASLFAKHIFNLLTNQTGMQFYVSVLADLYNVWTAAVGEAVFNVLHISVNTPGTVIKGGFHFNNWVHKFRIYEDFAFFGFNGAVMVVLLVICFILGLFQLFNRGSKVKGPYFIFTFLALAYLILISALCVWTPWTSRQFVLLMILAAPLIALIIRSNFRLADKCVVIMLVYSFFSLIPTTFMNFHKPLVPYKADIYGLSYLPLNRPEVYYYSNRSEKSSNVKQWPRIDGIGWSEMSLNRDRIGLRYIIRPYDEEFIRTYYAMVPPGSTVGTILAIWQWDYPLFGEGLSRQLTSLNLQNLSDGTYDYLLISESELRRKSKYYNEYRRMREIIEADYVRLNRVDTGQKYIGYAYNGKNMSLYVPKNREHAKVD